MDSVARETFEAARGIRQMAFDMMPDGDSNELEPGPFRDSFSVEYPNMINELELAIEGTTDPIALEELEKAKFAIGLLLGNDEEPSLPAFDPDARLDPDTIAGMAMADMREAASKLLSGEISQDEYDQALEAFRELALGRTPRPDTDD